MDTYEILSAQDKRDLEAIEEFEAASQGKFEAKQKKGAK